MSDRKNSMILWIGPLLNEPKLEEMVKNGECDTVSANLAEWNFLKYIVQESQDDIVVLSAIRTIEWPKNKKLYYRGNPIEAYFDGRLSLYNEGFCNAFGISHLSRAASLQRAAKRLARDLDPDIYVQVIVYSMHLPFMKAAEAFVHAHSNSCYKLIVPDLPLNMNTTTSIRRILKQIDWRCIQKHMCSVGGYILYTQQMANYLHLDDGQYMVCEGIANIDLISSDAGIEHEDAPDERTCIYAGNLDSKYGIERLIDVFGLLDTSDYTLQIFGRGSGEDKIAKKCGETENVQFMGFRPNHEIVEIEKRASFVINPRPTNLNCANYSCPSKTLEAMACGTPLITTRLPGIPSCYFDYLIELNDDSDTSIVESLQKAFDLEDSKRQKIGKEAQDFVLRRSHLLVRKILAFNSGRFLE